VVAARVTGHELAQPPVGFPGRASVQETDLNITAAPIHEGEHRTEALAVHRINFPMADRASILGFQGTFRDGSLAGEPAPAVIGPLAFTALLPGPSKSLPEISSMATVSNQILVDRLMAHGRMSLELQMS